MSIVATTGAESELAGLSTEQLLDEARQVTSLHTIYRAAIARRRDLLTELARRIPRTDLAEQLGVSRARIYQLVPVVTVIR